jgi:pyruvate/2-oxoglutarate dehydrogenase complex dihydrolipoamide dehydrogenase (E3) component
MPNQRLHTLQTSDVSSRHHKNNPKSREFGVHTEIKKIDFETIIERKRLTINRDINMIRTGLSNSKNIDYYTDQAEFTAHTPSKSETKT